MKKFSIYILLLVCLFITGCGEDKEKVAVTLDDFNTVLTKKNFVVTDNMEMYSEYDYILGSKIATYNDIEIEMVKYSDVESATKVHNNQIESFNLLKSTGAFEDDINGDNYHKYIMISNNRYMVSTRVDDTLIFCKTLLTNKELVEEIYNELDY